MSNLEEFVIKNGVLTKYNGPGGKVVIPEGVTSIESAVFWNQDNITEVLVPQGCGNVELNFRRCSALRYLRIPDSVTYFCPMIYYSVNKIRLELPMDLYRAFPLDSDAERDPMDRIDIMSLHDQTVIDLGLTGPEGLVGLFYSRLKTREEYYQSDRSLACNSLDAAGCQAYDAQLSREKLQVQLMGAMGRLYAPWELTQEHRQEFEALVRENAARCLTLVIGADDAERLSALSGLGLLEKKQYAKVLKSCKEKGAARCTAYLEEHAAEIQACTAPARPAKAEREEKKPAHPAEELAARNAEGINVKEILNKAGITGIQMKNLPDVLYADTGEKAAPEVLEYLLAAYMGQMKKRPPMSAKYASAYLPLTIDPAAEQVAALLEPTSLRQALEEVADLEHGTEKPQRLIPYARYAVGEQIQKLLKKMKEWADWSEFGPAGRSAIVVARGAVLLSDTREAMLYADKCGCLDYYASMRGSDAQSFRDTQLSDFGLDASGEKTYDLGGSTVIARLQPDLTLSLCDPAAGKLVKSIPKKNADPEKYEAAKADFAEMKKNLKKVAKARCDLLFQDFLARNGRGGEAWRASYLGNPLLRQIASLLVWSQDGATFTVKGRETVDAAGTPCAVTDGPVIVAHPMEMKPEEVTAWQKYFTSHGLKQPFAQIWEPVIPFGSVKPDRYQDVQIPAYRFNGQEKHGISLILDYGDSDVKLDLDDCRLQFSVQYGGVVNRHSFNLQGNLTLGAFQVTRRSRHSNHIIGLLDKWTTYGRVLKDDASVAAVLDGFTLAQVTELLNLAIENNCVNCKAALLEYKNQNFPDFDPMDAFTLE